MNTESLVETITVEASKESLLGREERPRATFEVSDVFEHGKRYLSIEGRMPTRAGWETVTERFADGSTVTTRARIMLRRDKLTGKVEVPVDLEPEARKAAVQYFVNDFVEQMNRPTEFSVMNEAGALVTTRREAENWPNEYTRALNKIRREKAEQGVPVSLSNEEIVDLARAKARSKALRW